VVPGCRHARAAAAIVAFGLAAQSDLMVVAAVLSSLSHRSTSPTWMIEPPGSRDDTNAAPFDWAHSGHDL
jgi:hypothetical protein